MNKMNIDKLKKYVRKSGDFGRHNAEAILNAIYELDKSIKGFSKQIPKIQIKEGRYKGLLERLIRQNKLIIDLLKLDHFNLGDEEYERLRDEVA